ncbi:broad-complex core protein isoforms 1/2/3/4/5-like isoform X1 [Thrips palmi]|uniref:Broad-complex core protein isoforms 1/2/3/4/5-like isoform X1 n=1 Tax=Thrips palmi TaxID=161013 RepID=A0A6P8ZZC2_THRPL|nr:broad-complex core protein isoforms 1/2/3/4/5-like isoform X1 [Thrips palmi]XP_034250775.1 broad-complex core protein isoforms 1/2/3/4/5-like isoform X1 [Thrips palmi]XP_034250777.1 broad-complex core protein isoforms 1/2/3/4/5-like isoform X1 [Thrips palmi]XP_034250778.1 broad-complex core protein isoforms 1/2/3/4/5-like isoform X1 [Thrips palmi]
MAAEQFCLRWNNFQSNIASALGSLKAEQDLVDVTLTCGGRSVKAHKVILSACSPYFRAVFKENPCQHPVVILKDVRYDDVLALLSFMYQGEVFITQDQLSTFLETAELLQVRGLTGAVSPVKESPQQKSGQGLAPPALSNILQKTFSKSSTITPSSGGSSLSRSSSFTTKHGHGSSKRHAPPSSTSPPSDALSNKEQLSAPSSPQHLPKRRKATPRRVSTSSLASSDAGTENANSNLSAPDPSRISDETLAHLENVTVNISEVKQEPADRNSDSGALENDLDHEDDGEVYNDHDEDDGDNDESKSGFYMEMDESNEAGTSSLLARSLAGVSPRSTDGIGGLSGNNQTTATDLTASDGGREGYFSNWSGGTLLNMENLANFTFNNGNSLDNSLGLNRRTPTTSSWSCMQPRSCTHCNRTFSNKFNLKQHIENVHTPSQAIPCHICNRSFKNKWYLRKHCVTSHGAPLRRIKTSAGKIVYVNEATSITPFYLNNKVDTV